MNILINTIECVGNGKLFHLTTGKKSAFVIVYPDCISVCCDNTAHQVFRGSGRLFPNLEAARAAYKSGDMKAMISFAVANHSI